MPDARLLAQILLHRDMFHSDLRIERLVAVQPPVTVDLRTSARHEEPGAALGMTLSARLLRYLGHPEGYGDTFLWCRALWLLRVECRRQHAHHRAVDMPHWRGALCHEMVKCTVVFGWSIAESARFLNYDRPEPVLRYALAYIESEMEHYLAVQRSREANERRASRARELPAHRQRDDLPPRGPHGLDGLHREECPQCRGGLAISAERTA